MTGDGAVVRKVRFGLWGHGGGFGKLGVSLCFSVSARAVPVPWVGTGSTVQSGEQISL